MRPRSPAPAALARAHRPDGLGHRRRDPRARGWDRSHRRDHGAAIRRHRRDRPLLAECRRRGAVGGRPPRRTGPRGGLLAASAAALRRQIETVSETLRAG
jgi:hypothetical protein